MLKEMVSNLVALALYLEEFSEEFNDLGDVLELVREPVQKFVSTDFPNLVKDHDGYYPVTEDESGIVFVLDFPQTELKEGVNQVYPHLEEGEDLVKLASFAKEVLNNDKQFSFAKVAFCGKGAPSIGLVKSLIVEEEHGGRQLRVLKPPIAAHAIGIDINPRAIEFAKLNSYFNGVDKRCRYLCSDIHSGLPKTNGHLGKTLYVANAPFALVVEGVEEDICRAGGFDGLTLTMEFLRQVKKEAKTGDCVALVAYSRMAAEGRIELIEKILELWGDGVEHMIHSLSHRPLCRGWNGKKEQPNPMPIENMVIRAHPDDHEKRELIRKGIEVHKSQGWTHLGYIGVILRVK